MAPCADICDDAGDTKVKQIERQRYCTYDVSYRAHMNSTCSKSLHGSANENVIHICRCVSATPSDQIIFQCVFHPWACRQFCTIILNNGFCFSVCSIDASNHVFILVQFRLLSTSPGKALTLPFKMQSVATSHRGHALEEIKNTVLLCYANFLLCICLLEIRAKTPNFSCITQSNYQKHALHTSA